jgi:hypothetical protein
MNIVSHQSNNIEKGLGRNSFMGMRGKAWKRFLAY